MAVQVGVEVGLQQTDEDGDKAARRPKGHTQNEETILDGICRTAGEGTVRVKWFRK